jgi:hypothetical protein
MPGSVANEFLVESACRPRLNTAVKKGDSTEGVKWEKGDWG